MRIPSIHNHGIKNAQNDIPKKRLHNPYLLHLFMECWLGRPQRNHRHFVIRVSQPHSLHQRRCNPESQRVAEYRLLPVSYGHVTLHLLRKQLIRDHIRCNETAYSVGCGFAIECNPSYVASTTVPPIKSPYHQFDLTYLICHICHLIKIICPACSLKKRALSARVLRGSEAGLANLSLQHLKCLVP